MKKVLLAAFAGLSVMFMAASSGTGNKNTGSQVNRTVSVGSWHYTGDSTTPKPDSPKYAMNVILSDTTKDTIAGPKFVVMVQRMISDTTKDSTKTGPKYYAIIEKLISDTTKDSTKLPKYDLAYNDRN